MTKRGIDSSYGARTGCPLTLPLCLSSGTRWSVAVSQHLNWRTGALGPEKMGSHRHLSGGNQRVVCEGPFAEQRRDRRPILDKLAAHLSRVAGGGGKERLSRRREALRDQDCRGPSQGRD